VKVRVRVRVRVRSRVRVRVSVRVSDLEQRDAVVVHRVRRGRACRLLLEGELTRLLLLLGHTHLRGVRVRARVRIRLG